MPAQMGRRRSSAPRDRRRLSFLFIEKYHTLLSFESIMMWRVRKISGVPGRKEAMLTEFVA
jgi:hypothetical protein